MPGWVLRRVYDGAALIEGRDGIIEVEPGVVAPGLGRIEGIKRQDGRWVVVTHAACRRPIRFASGGRACLAALHLSMCPAENSASLHK